MEKNMEKEDSHGLIPALITENLSKIISKVEESTTGPMAESMTVNGTIIRWKVKVFSLGLTEDATKEITSMTRKKEMASSIGLMVGNTKVAGRMANSTASVLTHLFTISLSKESGQMVKDSIGYQMMEGLRRD